MRDRLTGRNASHPSAGYDRLDDKRVVEGPSDHSQGELEVVEEILAVLKEADPVTIKKVDHDPHRRIGQPNPNPRAPRPLTSR